MIWLKVLLACLALPLAVKLQTDWLKFLGVRQERYRNIVLLIILLLLVAFCAQGSRG